jgi:hypothetical protein
MKEGESHHTVIGHIGWTSIHSADGIWALKKYKKWLFLKTGRDNNCLPPYNLITSNGTSCENWYTMWAHRNGQRMCLYHESAYQC